MDRFLRERGETFFILVISWIIQGRLINIVEKWGKEEGRAGISLFLVVAYVRESRIEQVIISWNAGIVAEILNKLKRILIIIHDGGKLNGKC